MTRGTSPAERPAAALLEALDVADLALVAGDVRRAGAEMEGAKASARELRLAVAEEGLDDPLAFAPAWRACTRVLCFKFSPDEIHAIKTATLAALGEIAGARWGGSAADDARPTEALA